MIPTPVEIEYFVELYQTKHVSRAAIRLGVTQPALSQILQRLEKKMSGPLFFRTKQGVVATALGTKLYLKSRSFLDQWNDFRLDSEHDSQALEGRFRVGCHPSVGAYVLPAFFERMNQQAPKIGISLSHDFSRKILEKVIGYEVDLAFVVNPAKHPDLVMKKIGDDQIMVWKQRSKSDVPKRLFANLELDQFERLSRGFKKHFEDWTLVSTPSFELIRELVSEKQGVGILPERVAHLGGTDLVPYECDYQVQHDEIYVVYRKEVLSSAAGKVLAKTAAVSI